MRRPHRVAVGLGDPVAEPGGLQRRPAGRERVRDDHLGARPDVGLVDALHHVGLLEIGPGTPGQVVHRHALSLELAAHAAVNDHQLAAGEPPGQILRRAHAGLLSW